MERILSFGGVLQDPAIRDRPAGGKHSLEGGGAVGDVVAFWTLIVATCIFPERFMLQAPPVCWPSSVRASRMRDWAAHWASPQFTVWEGTPHAVMVQVPAEASWVQALVCRGWVEAGMLQEPLGGSHLLYRAHRQSPTKGDVSLEVSERLKVYCPETLVLVPHAAAHPGVAAQQHAGFTSVLLPCMPIHD